MVAGEMMNVTVKFHLGFLKSSEIGKLLSKHHYNCFRTALTYLQVRIKRKMPESFLSKKVPLEHKITLTEQLLQL